MVLIYIFSNDKWYWESFHQLSSHSCYCICFISLASPAPLFWDKVLLCSLGWSTTYSVVQGSLEFTAIPAQPTKCWDYKHEHHTWPSNSSLLKHLFIYHFSLYISLILYMSIGEVRASMVWYSIAPIYLLKRLTFL